MKTGEETKKLKTTYMWPKQMCNYKMKSHKKVLQSNAVFSRTSFFSALLMYDTLGSHYFKKIQEL